MAKKTKYFFDPHSLTYEIVHLSWRKIALRVFGFLCASVVFGGLIMIMAYTYLDSPKEKILKEEIDQYRLQLSLYEKSIDELSASLSDLSKRDGEIYRVIFEADPLPDSNKAAGVSIDKYRNLKGFDDNEEIQRLQRKLVALAAQMKYQAQSYDDILARAHRKQDMLASIPAIQPIANKDLTRMASGFGYRIHPIYKTAKMHTGMDFAAPKGTEIYATGNGRVIKAVYDEGYGNHVIVDHGYGYQTLYAHMSAFKVREGETVNRGQVLGLIGSTGLSTSPHLHYEVIKSGNKVNPIHFYFNDLSPEDFERIKQLANTNNQSFD